MSENTFHFSLVSPEKILLSEQVTMVTVPGTDGEFGVLFNHAPILSSLKDGVVTIVNDNNETKRIFVAGGFTDMNENTCTLLAQDAINISDINKVKLENEQEIILEKLNMIENNEDIKQNKHQLNRQLDIIKQKLALIA